MANVVPLAVSGQISVQQTCILMSIVNSTPYYLVTDVNGIPYFQPLYQDVTTGLPVFENFAVRVMVSLGARVGYANSAFITNLSATFPGRFLADPNLLRIIAPSSTPVGQQNPAIPLEVLTFPDDKTLLVCGYNYILDNGYSFYITTNWSATPNAQAIGSTAQQPPTTSFYVFPIDGLVDSSGKPASSTVFSVIYNDVLGKTTETFLFTNFVAWEAGGGQPYYYCSNSVCGPACFGICRGQYSECIRLKDSTFGCLISVSWRCKVIALLPFLIPAVICMIALLSLLLSGKLGKRNPDPPHQFEMTKGDKAVFAVLLAIPIILIIIMMFLVAIDDNQVHKYLRTVCRLTGDYQ